MPGRDEGASGLPMTEAMGRAPRTVCGFLTGPAMKGMAVEVLEPVRQDSPNKIGAKGSFTVHRLVAKARP
jgi:hypothetical protein